MCVPGTSPARSHLRCLCCDRRYWGQKSKSSVPLAELCKVRGTARVLTFSALKPLQNPNVNIIPIGFVSNYFPDNSSMKFNMADVGIELP